MHDIVHQLVIFVKLGMPTVSFEVFEAVQQCYLEYHEWQVELVLICHKRKFIIVRVN